LLLSYAYVTSGVEVKNEVSKTPENAAQLVEIHSPTYCPSDVELKNRFLMQEKINILQK
jgi:hypothetical protein